MNKILAVSGSLRSGGNTDTLLEQFTKGASESGAEVQTIFLRNYAVNSCVGCEQCRGRGFCARFDDGMSLIYPEINSSTGLILGSPVYNYNVTSLMKAFIDRLFPYYIFTNEKPRNYSSKLQGEFRQAIVFGVGEQKRSRDSCLVLPAMAMPLEALGYSIMRQMTFHGLLEKDAVQADEKSLHTAYEAGAQLGSWLCLASGKKPGDFNVLTQGAGWRFPYV